ncbi:MAG: hypothetical protein ABIZ04_00850 [Opitutus sp.]
MKRERGFKRRTDVGLSRIVEIANRGRVGRTNYACLRGCFRTQEWGHGSGNKNGVTPEFRYAPSVSLMNIGNYDHMLAAAESRMSVLYLYLARLEQSPRTTRRDLMIDRARKRLATVKDHIAQLTELRRSAFQVSYDVSAYSNTKTVDWRSVAGAVAATRRPTRGTRSSEARVEDAALRSARSPTRG